MYPFLKFVASLVGSSRDLTTADNRALCRGASNSLGVLVIIGPTVIRVTCALPPLCLDCQLLGTGIETARTPAADGF